MKIQNNVSISFKNDIDLPLSLLSIGTSATATVAASDMTPSFASVFRSDSAAVEGLVTETVSFDVDVNDDEDDVISLCDDVICTCDDVICSRAHGSSGVLGGVNASVSVIN